MLRYLGYLFLILGFACSAAFGDGNAWQPLGPYGGDVRTLAAQPGNSSRVFLGTSNSQIYSSTDGGRSWAWWSKVSTRSDYVVDHLIVDPLNPSVMYSGVWSTDPGGGGGVFKSTDGGRTWTSLQRMSGESVRALAMWKGDSRVLVAGAISGVFRTSDGGRTWERISPPNHEEIRNVESVSIDPNDANVIYVGTWHLAWKTRDGGNMWTSIRTGMIDDSDVFSIQPDWSHPKRLYASACSGIYRSENAGELWRKIQGIPHSARRTRVMRQDPSNPEVVYAGTTEGLWRSESGGDSWTRLTSAALTVNDIFIDPGDSNRLLLGTDRAGLLLSADGGRTFEPSNQGFAHRQVSRTVFDPVNTRLYAAVLADKEYGGVFVTGDHANWRQVSKGLGDQDIFALLYARAADGTGRLLAGTQSGVMSFDEKTEAWSRIGRIVSSPKAELPGSDRTPYSQVIRKKTVSDSRRTVRRSAPKQPVVHAARVVPLTGEFRAAVNDFFQEGPGEPLYAATANGVFRSSDAGETWERLSAPFAASTVSVEGKTIAVGVPGGLEMSMNGGTLWFHIYLPTTQLYAHVNSIALAGRTMTVATDAGLFRSTDGGGNWDRKGNGLPYNVPVTSVRTVPGDPSRMFVASPWSGRVYASRDGGDTFEAIEDQGLAGRRPRMLVFAGRKNSLELVVASAFDGLFVRTLATETASGTQRGSAGQ